MKLSVLVGRDGKIIGTARLPDGATGVQSALRPTVGHTIHEIDVPDEYEKMLPSELHDRIREVHLKNHCG